jgi:hypothetical protein
MPLPPVRKAHKGVFQMKNWFKFLAIAARVVAIGFALAGCEVDAEVEQLHVRIPGA